MRITGNSAPDFHRVKQTFIGFVNGCPQAAVPERQSLIRDRIELNRLSFTIPARASAWPG